MDGKEYYDSLLKKKEWTLKRRIIFKRDGFKCTVCGKTSALQAHHTYYLTNTPPWDYPDDALLTLCCFCHDKFHREHEVPVLDKKTSEFVRNKEKNLHHKVGRNETHANAETRPKKILKKRE